MRVCECWGCERLFRRKLTIARLSIHCFDFIDGQSGSGVGILIRDDLFELLIVEYIIFRKPRLHDGIVVVVRVDILLVHLLVECCQ